MIRLSEILKKEELIQKAKREKGTDRAEKKGEKEEPSPLDTTARKALFANGMVVNLNQQQQQQGLLTAAFAAEIEMSSRKSEEAKTPNLIVAPTSERNINEFYNEMLIFVRRLMQEYKNKTYISIYKIEGLVKELINILSKECGELLLLTLESTRRNYLYAHTANTAILGAKFLIEEKFKYEDILAFAVGIFLHDLGMIDYIEIANQPRKLEKREFDDIKKHVRNTIDYLRAAGDGFLPDRKDEIIEIIYQHHTNVDGSGYPEEKVDVERINYFARVLRVIDSYEAMTHPRSWRDAYSPALAVDELARLKKTYYDVSVIKKFIDIFSVYPIGTIVKLNTQEVGRVCRTYKELPTRPAVEVLFDFENKKVSERRIIDLASTPMLSIVEVLEKLPT
jgi:HD-GYP domain-containing protein (c-di-GMP phosphodiesterase class II)